VSPADSKRQSSLANTSGRQIVKSGNRRNDVGRASACPSDELSAPQKEDRLKPVLHVHGDGTDAVSPQWAKQQGVGALCERPDSRVDEKKENKKRAGFLLPFGQSLARVGLDGGDVGSLQPFRAFDYVKLDRCSLGKRAEATA